MFLKICITLFILGIFILFISELDKRHKEELKRIEARRQEELRRQQAIAELENLVLRQLCLSGWPSYDNYDCNITVKSRKALENYDDLSFFKEDTTRVDTVDKVLKERAEIESKLRSFLANNEFKNHEFYSHIESKINGILKRISFYKVRVNYISSANNLLGSNLIPLDISMINKYKENPGLLMTKGEYSKYLKEQEKEKLKEKHQYFYSHVNYLVDYVNENKQFLILKGSEEKLDELMLKLFDRTVNSIKKIKTVDSEEWDLISDFIEQIRLEISEIMERNTRIINYYNSEDFLRVRQSCETLINSQKEFNEYIAEKVNSVATLFGTRVIRNETVNEDEYNYIRPYKKTITPFNAEVSANVFASAENNPMEYIVKYFYPNKSAYKEQIDKLYTLVEELETIKEAKQIIENYKLEYHQYLGNVPKYVLEEDESGFYSRLGFANIDESVLAVEYKFSYTSGGGMAQRSFTVPMTEENIIELIKILESKLTKGEFIKEQRRLMTKKLRDFVKSRDNYTCRYCSNSMHIEPNLLLEVDHIVPVAKGGCTVEDNLQTLCWKCNRSKGSKIV